MRKHEGEGEGEREVASTGHCRCTLSTGKPFDRKALRTPQGVSQEKARLRLTSLSAIGDVEVVFELHPIGSPGNGMPTESDEVAEEIRGMENRRVAKEARYPPARLAINGGKGAPDENAAIGLQHDGMNERLNGTVGAEPGVKLVSRVPLALRPAMCL